METEIRSRLETEIKRLVLEVFPQARFVAKYGGELVEAIPGDTRSQIGGLFFYKQHLSFEFSEGAFLEDRFSVLEGSGKYRRHMKIRNVEDLQEQALADLLKQARDRVLAD